MEEVVLAARVWVSVTPCPPVSSATGGRLLLAKVVLEVVIRPVVSAEG